MKNAKLRKILRVSDKEREIVEDRLIEQIEIEININGKLVKRIATLPENITELAIGYCFYKKKIHSYEQITDYSLDLKKKKFDLVISDLPGIQIKPELITQITPHKIYSLMQSFTQKSELFKLTGAVHSAGLIFNNEIICFANDIGRHNAIDKVIGMGILERLDLSKYWLFTSGRISLETVEKAINANIPIIVSHSAGMEKSIQLAEQNNIILIGFVRKKRMNVYCGWEHLEFTE
jgi:FdhD protein